MFTVLLTQGDVAEGFGDQDSLDLVVLTTNVPPHKPQIVTIQQHLLVDCRLVDLFLIQGRGFFAVDTEKSRLAEALDVMKK